MLEYDHKTTTNPPVAIRLPLSNTVVAFIAYCIDPTAFVDFSWQTLDILVLRKVVAAARTYQIHYVEHYVKVYTMNFWSLLARRPLELFSFVLDVGLHGAIPKAAYETLKYNIESEQSNTIFRNRASRRVFQMLLEYHRLRVWHLSYVFWRGCPQNIIIDKILADFRLYCGCGNIFEDPVAQALRTLSLRIPSYVESRPLAESLWSDEYWKREAGILSFSRCRRCGEKPFEFEKVLEFLRSSDCNRILPKFPFVCV